MTRAEKAELAKKFTEELTARPAQTEAKVVEAKETVKTFEIDGEQVPYDEPKPLKADSSISSAWAAITKAGRW